MKLSPLLIKKQEFTKSMRGYDADEVKMFLIKISNEFEALINENESLKESIESLNEKVNEFQKIEKNLQDTLTKAQDSSIRAMDSAKQQTDLMIKEAELKASKILEDAKRRSNEIKDAVENAREEKNLILARLKAIVNSQAQLLEGKLKDAGEEQKKIKQTEKQKNVDIDVDDIVKKLL